MAVFFNGNLLTTPTVASQINDSAMANQNIAMPMNLAIIGHADGGVPKNVYQFQSPQDAAAALKSGELLTAIQKAFAPSSSTNAPQTIFAVRVDPATQSVFVVPQAGAATLTGAFAAVSQPAQGEAGTVTLASTASGVDNTYDNYQILITSGVGAGQTNLITGYTGATKIATLMFPWAKVPQVDDNYQIIPAAMILKTQDYGVWSGQTAVKIETASGGAGYKVSVMYGQALYFQDNLTATFFTLQYTGAAASCLLSVNGSTLTISTGAAGSETVEYSVDLNTYSTVDSLVSFLDSKPDLEAVATPQYLSASTLNTMDLVSSVQVVGASPVNVTANLWAVLSWINSAACPLLTASLPPAFATGATGIPALCAYTYLTGGTCPADASTDWQDCFTLLQGEDVQCVVPLTSNPTYQAMSQTHVDFMSNQGKSERRTIMGGALGLSVAQLVTNAFTFNDDRCYLASCGYQDYDANGNLATYAPYMTAALLGGMICGLNPGHALTGKSINVAGLERYDLVPTDTDTLIQGGVLPLVKTKDGFQVCKSISTWLQNKNYDKVEMSTGYACDYVARTVRDAVQSLVGGEGAPYSLGTVASRVDTALRQLAVSAPQGMGVIVGDTNSPAYQNIVVTLQGDAVTVSWQCSPVIPMNYILMTISVVPYSGTLTVTSATSTGASASVSASA